jgi:hypothetical protein
VAVAQKKFSQRTDRVKAVDIHPTEPWILTSLYNGHVQIWNYDTGSTVKTFEVTELPIRAGKFVPRKQWIITGSDDFMIRAYNVNTQERVTEIHGGCRHHPTPACTRVAIAVCATVCVPVAGVRLRLVHVFVCSCACGSCFGCQCL